jgi:hypothetical protein
MTINHWSLPISANVPIYLTNSLQNFSHFLLRPVQWPQEEKAARSLEDTWWPIIGDVLEDGMGKPPNEMVDEGLMNGDLTTIKGFDAPQKQ